MKPAMNEHGEYSHFLHVRWFYAHVNNTMTHQIITESDCSFNRDRGFMDNKSHSDVTIRYSVKTKHGWKFIYCTSCFLYLHRTQHLLGYIAIYKIKVLFLFFRKAYIDF